MLKMEKVSLDNSKITWIQISRNFKVILKPILDCLVQTCTNKCKQEYKKDVRTKNSNQRLK